MGSKTVTRRFAELRNLANNNELPFAVTYEIAANDFGAGDTSTLFAPPPGKIGIIVDVSIDTVSETFNAVTTSARVDIGTASDADAHVISADIGTLAANAVSSLALTEGVSGNQLSPDTDFDVNCIAPTGGVPAGIATVRVTVVWK